MSEKVAAEHNRLFHQASAIVKGQIPLDGRLDMPVPGWLLSRKLKHAIVLFEHVVQINPKNWSAMWFIGKVHQRFRNAGEALSWFERSYQITRLVQIFPVKLLFARWREAVTTRPSSSPAVPLNFSRLTPGFTPIWRLPTYWQGESLTLKRP